MLKKLLPIIAFAVILIAVIFSGCDLVDAIAKSLDNAGIINSNNSSLSEISASAADDSSGEDSGDPDVSENDISTMMTEIYAGCDVMGVVEYDDDALKKLMFIDLDDVEEYHVSCTNGKFGVADIAVIKPVSGSKDKVSEALRQFLEARAAGFEDYDVNDALKNCREGEIYSKGDYVIMVAFGDNSRVKSIIDKYIKL